MAKSDSSSAGQERAEIRKTTDKVKESAKNIEDSTLSIEDTSNQSTRLAADRTIFAAERTYAAWVRTGLASLASGVGARTLLEKVVPGSVGMFASSILIAFSAFCFCAAVWRELLPSFHDPLPQARRLPRIILFLINGSLIVVALSALVGIWIIRFGLIARLGG